MIAPAPLPAQATLPAEAGVAVDRPRLATVSAERHADPRAAWLPCLLALLLVGLLLSLALGRYPLQLTAVLDVFGSRLGLSRSEVPEAVSTVILHVRLPRILAAMAVGGGLGLAGSSYQGLFRNPLVSPDILGAAAGASFGACVGIISSQSILVTQILALSTGLAAVCAVLIAAAHFRTVLPTLSLVLTGILVSTVFQALVAGAKCLADPYDKLPTILFWLLGSFARVNARDLAMRLAPILLGGAALFAVRWHLNSLAFGEDEAVAMEAEAGKLRVIIIGASTMITSASVAVCGVVGWVGLVIPHLARSLVGADHRRLLPVSAVLGALFLLLVDDVVRMMGAIEVPIGVLTALIGAPCFLLPLSRTGKTWT